MKLNAYGKIYDVMVKTETYVNNNNLAVIVYETDDEYYPFAFLTINTDVKLPKNMAFVDINNCEWAEEFIKDNELGEPANYYNTSGYVDYPLYKFDLEKVNG